MNIHIHASAFIAATLLLFSLGLAFPLTFDKNLVPLLEDNYSVSDETRLLKRYTCGPGYWPCPHHDDRQDHPVEIPKMLNMREYWKDLGRSPDGNAINQRNVVDQGGHEQS